MLQNNFLLQLMANGLPLQTWWFMQDGATQHTRNVLLNLNTVFSPYVMSDCCSDHHSCSNFWPHVSPDLNPCDFFLWGFLKEKVFPRKPSNDYEMRGMLVKLCREIEEDMCCRFVMSMCLELQAVTLRNGGHIEHILTQKIFPQMCEQYVWRL
jgi:hypothetical protein